MPAHSLATVLCAGNIVLDILVRPVDRLSWGTTTWVDSVEQHLGGNGASTSYTLAQLGVPVRLLGMLGRDSEGDRLLARLNAAGVDTGLITRTETLTAATVALVNSEGNRLFLHRPGSSAEAFRAPIEFTPALVEGASHFHLANLFALPSMRPHAAETLRRARAAGLSTSLDAGWDSRGRWLGDLGPSVPHVDLLFVNEDEARMLTGLSDPAEAAAALGRLGARHVVVKLGARGCGLFSSGDAVHVPGFEVEAVDTTGAGDCFAGGYLAALQRGYSHEAAARLANGVGALAVQRLGAVEGVVSWEETEAWMKAAGARR
jgi:sugar/nucleoside kinase (ribokinase family)